jgi:uncharacterized coiled-coil protein SlyX
LPIKFNKDIDLETNVKLIIKYNSELNKKLDIFLELLKSNHPIKKETNKINEFYKYEFKDLLNELNKQKIEVKLSLQSELLDTFNKFKNEIIYLKEQIDNTDEKIDQLIYKLYELTPEEIKLIENSVK